MARRPAPIRIESLEHRLLFAAGDLDPSFSGDGKQSFFGIEAPSAIAVQTDGKVLFSGGSLGSGYFSRLNANGSRDLAFGADGDNNGRRDTDVVADFVLLPNGKFVGVGNGYVQRFNANGSIDNSFTATFLNHSAILYKIAAASDGKIVVATQNGNNQEVFVYRLNANGGLDTSLDFDGEFTVPVIGMETLREVAVAPDRKILVAGNERYSNSTTQSNFLVARFNVNGQSLDQNYGTVSPAYGAAFVDFGGFDRLWGMSVGTDGSVIIAGGGGPSGAGGMAVAKLTPQGRLATSFSGDGKLVLNPFEGVSNNSSAWDVVALPDNKILLGGIAGGQFAVARLLPGGTLDPSFGGNGTVRTNFAAGLGIQFVTDLAVGINGRAVLGGFVSDASNNPSQSFLRYQGDAPVTLSGWVYTDTDGDGGRDAGETNRANVRVYVDLDRDNTWDAAEPNVLTNSGGNYSFTGLAPGTYRLRINNPSGGFRTSVPVSGSIDRTVAAGGTSSGNVFAVTQRVLISGTVFNDLNANGVKNGGESGRASVRVYIDADNDGKFDAGEKSVFTDASGSWAFRTLVAGTYRVRVVPPSGLGVSTPSGGLFLLALTNGQSATGRLFGVAPLT